MRTLTLAFALVATTACTMHEPGPGVTGSADDVTTTPGDYAGYRVVMPCEGTWTDVGVIGAGSIELTGVDAISAAGQELRTRTADISSIHGWGGYGLACEPGIGTTIHLSDWREVDLVIARAGDWLRERDHKLQVGISVGGIPVPN